MGLVSYSGRGRSPLPRFALTLSSALLVSAGAVSSLWALGVVDLPFLNRTPTPAPAAPTGTPVPLSSRAIAAYSKVTRDQLMDSQSGAPTVIYLPADQVASSGYLTRPEQILGRVLRRDKQAGYAFTEKDFFPPGTRPGLAAGIPPGQLALVIEGNRIRGVHGLKAGDRFALLAAEPTSPTGGPAPAGGSGPSSRPAGRGSIRVLVQEGVIVVPAAVPPAPTGARDPKGAGGRPHTATAELTIALDPQEVGPLTEALAAREEILCVARSGHPDDDGSSRVAIDPKPPASSPRFIETLVGKRRQLVELSPAPDAAPGTPRIPPPLASVRGSQGSSPPR